MSVVLNVRRQKRAIKRSEKNEVSEELKRISSQFIDLKEKLKELSKTMRLIVERNNANRDAETTDSVGGDPSTDGGEANPLQNKDDNPGGE